MREGRAPARPPPRPLAGRVALLRDRIAHLAGRVALPRDRHRAPSPGGSRSCATVDAGGSGGPRAIADAQNAKWKKRAPWRYTTKVPTADWAEPTFRDSTWKRTNKPLGFGNDASFMRMAERWTTSDVWLRRHFSWKAATVTRVVFDIYHDEDVEIYLNGTSIFNKRGWNHSWEPFEVPVDMFTSAVREGDNVLAVKVHDNGAPRYFDYGLSLEIDVTASEK